MIVAFANVIYICLRNTNVEPAYSGRLNLIVIPLENNRDTEIDRFKAKMQLINFRKKH